MQTFHDDKVILKVYKPYYASLIKKYTCKKMLRAF